MPTTPICNFIQSIHMRLHALQTALGCQRHFEREHRVPQISHIVLDLERDASIWIVDGLKKNTHLSLHTLDILDHSKKPGIPRQLELETRQRL